MKKGDVILSTRTINFHHTQANISIDPTHVVTDIDWQQPTYFLEKDDNGKTEYTCDPTKTECRANLLVTPKLDGVESTQLTCRITTDFGIEENDCNPDTFTIPTGEHTLTIEIHNATTDELISTRTMTLH